MHLRQDGVRLRRRLQMRQCVLVRAQGARSSIKRGPGADEAPGSLLVTWEFSMRRFLSAILVACAFFVFTPAHMSSAQVTPPEDSRLVLPAPKSGHARPLVVIVADAAGAETTDFIVPYGVLREANVADVRTVSTAPEPLQLMMQLRVQPDETTAAFDTRVPEGADIVIVPAQMAPRSPALSAWLQRQAQRGATIVSICEGARVLAHPGMLRGRRATSHYI